MYVGGRMTTEQEVVCLSSGGSLEPCDWLTASRVHIFTRQDQTSVFCFLRALLAFHRREKTSTGTASGEELGGRGIQPATRSCAVMLPRGLDVLGNPRDWQHAEKKKPLKTGEELKLVFWAVRSGKRESSERARVRSTENLPTAPPCGILGTLSRGAV